MKQGSVQNNVQDSREKTRAILIPGIALSLDEPQETALSEAKKSLSRIGFPTRDAVLSVYKRSVDARVRNGVRTVRFVYSVLASYQEPILLNAERKRGLAKLSARAVAVSEGLETENIFGN